MENAGPSKRSGCEPGPVGGSLRAWERATGFSRGTLAREIAAGRLQASRVGARRYFVTREAIEAWLRIHEVRPSAHAEKVVEQVLKRA